MSEYDPEIEKMILYGIDNINYYTSPKRDGKLKYRAISDLEERFAFKDLLSEIPLDTDEQKLELFDNTKNEKETFKERMTRFSISPLDVEIANYQHRISIVYHGIKDFHLPNCSYEEGLELVSRFPESDINELSDLILEKSSKTHKENENRVSRFRASNK